MSVCLCQVCACVCACTIPVPPWRRYFFLFTGCKCVKEENRCLLCLSICPCSCPAVQCVAPLLRSKVNRHFVDCVSLLLHCPVNPAACLWGTKGKKSSAGGFLLFLSAFTSEWLVELSSAHQGHFQSGDPPSSPPNFPVTHLNLVSVMLF